MMQDTVMDKTRLAAFADGELPPEEAAAVVMHLADHPQDQAFVDDLMAANQALLRAFSAPMAQPVPTAILTAVQGSQAAPAPARVVAFPVRAVWALAGIALAASVVLAVVWVPGQEANGVRVGPVASSSALHDHLTALGSGQTVEFGPGALTILATLPVDAGHCREVEVSTALLPGWISRWPAIAAQAGR
jgi:anti-sigma factor RsiW